MMSSMVATSDSVAIRAAPKAARRVVVKDMMTPEGTAPMDVGRAKEKGVGERRRLSAPG